MPNSDLRSYRHSAIFGEYMNEILVFIINLHKFICCPFGATVKLYFFRRSHSDDVIDFCFSVIAFVLLANVITILIYFVANENEFNDKQLLFISKFCSEYLYILIVSHCVYVTNFFHLIR